MVSSGDRFGGVSIYILNNRLHYVYNLYVDQYYHAASSRELPLGKATLKVQFEKQCEGKAVVTLYQNSQAVIPEQYGKFLCEIFDLWYEDFIHGESMDIRMFSNLAQMSAGYPAEECGMNGCLAHLRHPFRNYLRQIKPGIFYRVETIPLKNVFIARTFPFAGADAGPASFTLLL